jgi:hypothetical protein
MYRVDSVPAPKPQGPFNPVTSIELQNWLDEMDGAGWELVGFLPYYWHIEDIPRTNYVFRRPYDPDIAKRSEEWRRLGFESGPHRPGGS